VNVGCDDLEVEDFISNEKLKYINRKKKQKKNFRAFKKQNRK